MKFLKFLAKNGTISQYSCLGTSQQNGRAERKHRHILDTIRELLMSFTGPESFWGELMLIVAYTINHIPSFVIENESPYECLYGIIPNYDLFRVFGCTCL